jgi:hypothetical protein
LEAGSCQKEGTKNGGGVELFWFFDTQRVVPGWIGLSELPSKMNVFEVIQAIGTEALLSGALFVFIIVFRLDRSRT